MTDKQIKIPEYKRCLFSKKVDNNELVHLILSQCSYELILKYYNATPKTLKGMYKHYLNYLIKKSYDDIYKNGGDFLKEPIDYVGLMAFVLPFFKEQINLYISIRDKYEDFYLTNNLKECNLLLEQSNNEISFSVWSATNKIKLGELEGGMHKRMSVYNNIVNVNTNPIMSYFCNQAQFTASIEASIQPFIEQSYKEIQAMPIEDWQKDYLVSQTLPYKIITPDVWLSYCMRSSIIDVYNNFIYHLHLIIEKYRNEEKILRYLEIIVKYIKDSYLIKYLNLIQQKNTIDKDRNIVVKSKNIKLLEDYIYHHPSDIDILIQYVSLSVAEKKIVGKEDGNLVQRIISHLYHVLNNDDFTLHAKKLEMICLSNQTIFSFKQLYYFINDITANELSKLGINNWCFSKGNNCLDAKFYQDVQQQILFLKAIGYDCNFQINKYSNIDLTRFFLLSINEQLLSRSRQELESMVKEDNFLPYIKSKIVSYLFYKYINERNLKNAILLYVNTKIDDPTLNIIVDKKMIESEFTRHIDIQLNCPLELSIFYSMINAKPAKISANSLRFLKSKGVDKPSDLKEISSKKIIYFLESVVDENILDMFPISFEDKIQVIQERINICRRLKSVSNNKKYSDEINRLLTEMAVIKNLKQVDESKIDVDITLLKKSELSNAKDFFDLMCDTPNEVKYRYPSQLFDLMFSSEKNVGENQIIRNQDSLHIIPYRQYLFTRYYLSVRDAFLFSDVAGLDYYLSSNIRHGTVVNQLRNNFQELKLTTRKSQLDGYDSNLYWVDNVFKVQGEIRTKIIEKFLNFTQNIDSLIQELKNIKIQIKTESYNENIPACFNYSLAKIKERIHKIYKESSNNYEITTDAIIEDLWQYSETCFDEMKLQVSLCGQNMSQAIDILKTDIFQILPQKCDGLINFKDTITKCHTLLENNIETIRNWFQRSQNFGLDFTMSDLVETAIEGINRNSDKSLEVCKQIDSYSKIQGKHLGRFYTLFHDIYNNVMDYYDNKNHVATCETYIKEDNNKIYLVIKNKLDTEDIAFVKQRIKTFNAEKTKANLSHKARTEKNSGLHKIYNLLFYQFAHEDNKLDVSLEELFFKVSIVINIKNLRVV